MTVNFQLVQTLVTLARQEQITKVNKLKQRLSEMGYEEVEINAAIKYWANRIDQDNHR